MPPDKRKRKVLLVDDSMDIRKSMSFLLEVDGYEVQCAENGKEALELLRSSPTLPSVIILDMMMPVMDGAGFRKEQLRSERLAKIPTVLVTALSRSAMPDSGALGFSHVLSKPISVEELLSTLEVALSA